MHVKNLIYNWLAKKSDPSPGSGSKHLLSPGLVRLISIFLLLLLLCSGVPVWAAEDENILNIDPDDPPDNILNQADVDEITDLWDFWSIDFHSEISPDRKTVLLRGHNLKEEESVEGFFNIETEEFTIFDDYTKDLHITHKEWINDNFMALTLTDHTQTKIYTGFADKRNGRIWVEDSPLPVQGEVLSLSPDFSKLVIFAPVQDSLQRALTNRVPTIESPSRFLLNDESTNLSITRIPGKLVLFDLDNMQEHTLMTLPATSTKPRVTFSPDSTKLVMTQNYYIDKDERVKQALTAVQVQDALGDLEPENNPMYTNSKLLLFDTQTPSAEPLSLNSTDIPIEFARFTPGHNVKWSPSGDKFIVASDIPSRLRDRDWPIYWVPESKNFLIYNQNLQLLNQIDKAPLNYTDSVEDVAWVSDNELVFKAVDELDHSIFVYDLSNSEMEKIIDSGTVEQMRIIEGKNELLLTRNSADQPPEIWKADLKSKEHEQLTEINVKADQAASVAVHEVQFTLESGAIRKAYWFAPESMAWPPKNEPVVFWQQGGPGVKMINTWSPSVETTLTLLPSMGISVLMVPLQERPGWGIEMWNELAQEDNFGKVDIDELAEIAELVIDKGWSSKGQLGITGCSYGGYMSSMSIVRHPELWSAANPQCSLLDLITEFQTGYADFIAYLTGGTPWEKWEHYITASPGFHGNQVKADTLIFKGTKDFLPLGIAENFYYDIQAAGTNARLLRFLGEPHGIYSLSGQLYAAQEQIKWFRDKLD